MLKYSSSPTDYIAMENVLWRQTFALVPNDAKSRQTASVQICPILMTGDDIQRGRVDATGSSEEGCKKASRDFSDLCLPGRWATVLNQPWLTMLQNRLGRWRMPGECTGWIWPMLTKTTDAWHKIGWVVGALWWHSYVLSIHLWLAAL